MGDFYIKPLLSIPTRRLKCRKTKHNNRQRESTAVVFLFMATKFETRSNPATSNLDVKDPTTGEWVQAIAKLRTAGGDDVKLIPEQLQLIEQIKSALSPLSQIAKTIQQSEVNNRDITDQLEEIQVALSALGDSNTSIGNELNAIAASISTVTEALNRSAEATTSLSNRLSGVPQSLVAIESAIADLATMPELIKKQTENAVATTKFSTTVSLEANKEAAVPLPGGTKTLYFSVRKNELGQSFDLRHAMKAGEVNIAAGKYETLWAYSEFRETGLLLNDAILYLAISSPSVVEVHAWY